jgi:hypothetical protein
MRPGLSLSDIRSGFRLVHGVARAIGCPIEPGAARRVVEGRLARRERDFLALVRAEIYARPGHPSRELLAVAGCELGDLERLVMQDGVEGALAALARAGVYLTADELRGRHPTVRGGRTIPVTLAACQPGAGRRQLRLRSSGTRGAHMEAVVDVASIRDQAHDLALVLEARGGREWPKAIWGVPGSVALVRLIDLTLCGPTPARWFAQVDPSAAGLHPRYRWSVRALRWGARCAGVVLPPPVRAQLDDPRPVARWLAETRRHGQTPLLWGHVSPVVRLCEVALREGIDLVGVQGSVGGAPCTPARLAAIRRAGVVVVPHYASMEAGLIAYGCLTPTYADDLHLLTDLHAIIRSEAGPRGLAPGTLLLSTLRPSARFVLLNASLGDRGELATRRCGCALETVGWTHQVHHVRSFEKLTAGGVTFLDRDIIPVLEETMPGRFGGGPLDYQLSEEEGPGGSPRIALRIHPSVGTLDSAAVIREFLGALGRGSGAPRVAALQWEHSGWIVVDRRPPVQGVDGKVLHLHRPVASRGT